MPPFGNAKINVGLLHMRLIYLLILAVFVGCAPRELPHPALSPQEVVHINFLALQQNDFRPLINCRHFEIRTHFQEKSEAEFLVLIEDSEGEVHSYMVSLSLQKYPPYDDCWMIDAVIPMRLPSKDGPRVAFFTTFNYWPAPFL